MGNLSESSAKLREIILKSEDLTEAQVEILDASLSARDLWHRAEKQIDIDGLVVKGDRGNIKAHPLCSVIRDAKSQFLAGFKMLDLHCYEAEEPRAVGSPSAYDRWRNGNRF